MFILSWDDQTFACLFRTYQGQAWQAFAVERNPLSCLCCVLKDDQNTCDLKTLFKTQFKVCFGHNFWYWWWGSPVKTLTPQFSTEFSDEEGSGPQFPWYLLWASTGHQPKLSPVCTWRHSATSYHLIQNPEIATEIDSKHIFIKYIYIFYMCNKNIYV